MTFREKQIALMEAYAVEDPQQDFGPLIAAMIVNPSFGCAILEVTSDPVYEYHAQREEESSLNELKRAKENIVRTHRDNARLDRTNKAFHKMMPHLAEGMSLNDELKNENERLKEQIRQLQKW